MGQESSCVWACVWGSKPGRWASCLDMNAAVYWLTGYMGEERSLGERRRGHLIGTSVSSDINSPCTWESEIIMHHEMEVQKGSGGVDTPGCPRKWKPFFKALDGSDVRVCKHVIVWKVGEETCHLLMLFQWSPTSFPELHCSEHSWWQCPTGCDFCHCSHRRSSSELQVKVHSVLFLQKTSHSITVAPETGGIVANPEAQSHILLSVALSFIHLH